MLLSDINTEKLNPTQPVGNWTLVMPDAIATELKFLLSLLGQCLTSCCEDLNKVDCKSTAAVPATLIPHIIEKLKRLVTIGRSIQKICHSLRERKKLADAPSDQTK